MNIVKFLLTRLGLFYLGMFLFGAVIGIAFPNLSLAVALQLL